LSHCLFDFLRQPLGGDPLGIAHAMGVIIQGSLRVGVSHQSGHYVYRSPEVEQFAACSMAETMDSDANPFRAWDSEFGHGPMDPIFDYVVGEIGSVLRVDKQIALRVGLIAVLKPILQVPPQLRCL